MTGIPRIDLDRQDCHAFDAASSREWLVTNGLGGYAAGTVSGAATRRYHGLLVAALDPPLGRTVLVAGLEITAVYRGRDFPLTSHEYAGGAIHPEGWRHTEAFSLNGGTPVWNYALGDARLSQSIWMGRQANVTYVRFRLEQASGPVHLRLVPLCTARDYHALVRPGQPLTTVARDGGVRLDGPGCSYSLTCAGATFALRPDWYWNFRYRRESERGLDDTESLLCPGTFTVILEPGGTATLVCAADPTEPEPAVVALGVDQRRRAALLSPLRTEPGWVRQLLLAADQFLARRGDGTTVLAGYPWFGDWGRDTMIALPGLTLPVGRATVAASILRTFARHLKEGLLPNRFPDAGGDPEYNTADATLWFFHAVDAYLRATRDEVLLRQLWPQLVDTIAWQLRGTLHGIGVDPEDGLLRAGVPGVQLTWMDAKVGDDVVTPRIGKPVEINALWHHALQVMAELAGELGDRTAAHRYRVLAAGAAESFRARFWNPEGGCLYDVVDAPGGDDASLRPNQLFAVSLPSRLLEAEQARAVVAICQRELLTPMGLRSLAPSDPRYVGTYAGGPAERDRAYHQGTVWSWLLGPFALAHFQAHGDRAAARALLAGIGSHLAEGCVGSVSEIFDGDAPHQPRGCFAQAWSVAEILRAWFQLKDAR